MCSGLEAQAPIHHLHLKIQSVVSNTPRIKVSAAPGALESAIHILSNRQFAPARAAQNGYLIVGRCRPPLRRVIRDRLMASVTRVISNAARKLNGYDIELGVVVEALCIWSNFQATNLMSVHGSLRRHLTAVCALRNMDRRPMPPICKTGGADIAPAK